MKTMKLITAFFALAFVPSLSFAAAPAKIDLGALPSSGVDGNPTANDLARKYAALFDSARVGGEALAANRIAGEIASDLRRFQPIANTQLASEKSGAAKEVKAARLIVTWLSGPLSLQAQKLRSHAK